MANNPTSTGIGAPGTAPAPANLSRSPMASQPNAQAMAIPFTRGSTLATMKDATLSSLAAGSTTQVQLQTNAFLENVILDVSIVSGGTNSATVVWQKDAPFNVIAQIKLDDPAGQSIVAPITGFQLYTLNKYLLDTDCNFDPARDSGYYQLPTAASNSSSAAGAGVASFRLVVPIEHRRRDALGALNNSAANQRYLLTITTASSYAAGTDTANNLFSTAPTNTPTVSVSVYQQYWTAPPAVITTSSGSTQVQATPAGLGTVAFVRYERHNEVSGGGQPQIQLNNVGDYIANIIFTLRTTTGTNTRDVYTAGAPGTQTDYANWPAEFDWWENDFQVFALSQNDWVRWISRFYGLWNGVSAQAGNPGYLDAGVWPLYQLSALFDSANNFGPANQYLPTDATTKLQIRGSSWGSSSSYLEVVTRNVRPVSGAALFA